MLGRLLKSQAATDAAAFALGAYLRLALATTRWTIEGFEHLAPFASGGAVVVAFWHESLPLMPALWTRARRQNPAREAAVLVSRHRDGRLIGRVMARFGLVIVHGSSAVGAKPKRGAAKGGAAGLRALLASLAQGSAVVITPDGPRGPWRVAAPGTTQLAAASGAAILPAAGRITGGIALRSWDRMVVPLPFGRGALVCLPPIAVPADGAEAALPVLEAALTEAATRACRLCGVPCPA